MADRKISELAESASVASGDVMICVTGVGVAGATLATKKFPLSGLLNHVIDINALVTQGTGIHLIPTVATTVPNTLEINVSGYAYESHVHTASDVTNFASASSGVTEQNVKFQSADLAAINRTTVASTDLVIPLSANSKYLCELGTVIVNNETSTTISGFVEITGTTRVNSPTQMYGTWNFLDTNTNSQGAVTNTINPISRSGALTDSLDSTLNDQTVTLVNTFMVETTNNESDTATFKFAHDSTDAATSGVLKKGSWFKAEKVI